MSEQRLLDQLAALDADDGPWWMWNLPDDGPVWTSFEHDTAYGIEDASGPISAATIHAHLDVMQTRKRRLTHHALLCFAVVAAFTGVFALDVGPVLASDAAVATLTGGAIVALLLAPSFVRGYARAEKRLTLYRLLAAHYADG